MENLLNTITVGILVGGIYGLVSLGLNLIFGVIRIVNFAQGEFVMLSMYGAYAAYSLLGLDPYIALLIVMPAMFLVGAIVQLLVMQPLQNEPMMQMFATFGLLMMFQNGILAATDGTGYSVPSVLNNVTFSVGPVLISAARLVVLVAVTLVALGLGLFLKWTVAGKAIRAVTQDRRAALLMGINVRRMYMITFGIGTALAGFAGCLLAPLYTLSPQIGGNFIMPAFAVVVLGGLGSVAGAFFGGFIVGLTEAFAGFYIDPALKHAVLFLVFIGVLLIKPSGLLGHAGAEEVGLREQA